MRGKWVDKKLAWASRTCSPHFCSLSLSIYIIKEKGQKSMREKEGIGGDKAIN
jgi:hypothetical protein